MAISRYDYEERNKRVFAKLSKEFIELSKHDATALHIIEALIHDIDPLVLLQKIVIERAELIEKMKVMLMNLPASPIHVMLTTDQLKQIAKFKEDETSSIKEHLP